MNTQNILSVFDSQTKSSNVTLFCFQTKESQASLKISIWYSFFSDWSLAWGNLYRAPSETWCYESSKFILGQMFMTLAFCYFHWIEVHISHAINLILLNSFTIEILLLNYIKISSTIIFSHFYFKFMKDLLERLKFSLRK